MASGNADSEWTTVADETPAQVIFDTIGDTFEGTYVEKREIVNPNPDPKTGEHSKWNQYVFRGTDGELYGINESYSIAKGMAEVPFGTYTQLEYKKSVEVGRPSPMRDFIIRTRASK